MQNTQGTRLLSSGRSLRARPEGFLLPVPRNAIGADFGVFRGPAPSKSSVTNRIRA